MFKWIQVEGHCCVTSSISYIYLLTYLPTIDRFIIDLLLHIIETPYRLHLLIAVYVVPLMT